jgi:hypothetical protein
MYAIPFHLRPTLGNFSKNFPKVLTFSSDPLVMAWSSVGCISPIGGVNDVDVPTLVAIVLPFPFIGLFFFSWVKCWHRYFDFFTHCSTYFLPLVASIPVLVPPCVMTTILGPSSLISADIF